MSMPVRHVVTSVPIRDYPTPATSMSFGQLKLFIKEAEENGVKDTDLVSVKKQEKFIDYDSGNEISYTLEVTG